MRVVKRNTVAGCGYKSIPHLSDLISPCQPKGGSVKIEIGIINGVGGKALIINRTRVAGPKPLGGGRITETFWVEEKAILDAIGHVLFHDAKETDHD